MLNLVTPQDLPGISRLVVENSQFGLDYAVLTVLVLAGSLPYCRMQVRVMNGGQDATSGPKSQGFEFISSPTNVSGYAKATYVHLPTGFDDLMQVIGSGSFAAKTAALETWLATSGLVPASTVQ